ncbi:conserved hypothetical protein [Paecilomyces variotii No. 5]|uniref:Non-homologous end-joining factor 1 n=1 Tax=Byssochlamys spectabilis (strain No. 5 / NBRC 109023) TaxID=1356009 RepID=V5FAH6_BYSSN|nr:conserved hypothetical protein [Paecilomyces variotii No. 5]
MPQNWRKLPLPETDGLPPLLFKYISSSRGYEIYLTDLTYIWTERLNHKQALKRAEDEEASIDPSEDAEQFKVLLQKIEDALCGAEGSSLTLNAGAKSNSLELTTKTRLPAPLHALEWTLYMTRGPQSSLTRELLLPLLIGEASRERRQKSLLDHLKEKDWVIGKVFDKIESSGLDLSTVFPGTASLRAGKRGTTRTQAEKLIRGVAPFDEKSWKSETSKDDVDTELAPKLVEELLNTTGSSDLRSFEPASDAWWEDLTVESRAPQSRGEKKKISQEELVPSSKKMKDTEYHEDSDDEFQRQATPPHLKRTKYDRHQRSPSVTNAPRKSPTKSPSPSPEKPAPKPTSKGLGVIGGPKPTKKEPPRPPSSTASEVSEPSHRSPVPEPDLDQETAPEDEEDAEPQPIPKPQQVEKEPVSKLHSRGLGVIGGKKAKAPSPSLSPSPSPPPEKSTTKSPSAAPDAGPASHSPQKPKPRGKLGTIGGGARSKPIPSRPAQDVGAAAAESTESDAEDDLDRVSAAPKTKAPSRSSSPAAQPAVKQEKEPGRELTAQEKANKKREQLKRELEAKSKAPAKKKRKF